MSEQEIVKEEKSYRGPIKIIMGLFLLLLIVLWLVPYYGVKQNPEPNYLPSLVDFNLSTFIIPNINSTDIRDYVQTTSEIKQVADKVVSLSCQQTSRVCNAKAIFYFVQENFQYVNDPLYNEHFKTPQEFINSGVGDCDDFSVFLVSTLQSIGFQTRFVFVPRHVYVQVKIPEAVSSYKNKEGWINLDATCQSCDFGEVSYQYVDSQKNHLS